MKNISLIDFVALALLIIGGINWGSIALLDIDLVSTVFGEMTTITRIVYGLVAVSAVYMVFSAFIGSVVDSQTTYTPVKKVSV